MAYPSDHDGTSRRAVSLVVLLTCLLMGSTLPAHAEDNATDSADPDDRKSLASALDGLAFKGEIGEVNGPLFSNDVWIFDQGMLASRKCRACGKAEYWLRAEDGGIRFRAEEACADTDVNLFFAGLVKDGRIEGTFTWTKNRWYGDIDEQFRFEGESISNAELSNSESSSSCSKLPFQRPSAPRRAPSATERIFRFP